MGGLNIEYRKNQINEQKGELIAVDRIFAIGLKLGQ